ncbi:hypothetical protein NCLIV_001980 [Neospora caninum Liverpool]|uniref:1-phosphatidylinositol 4-kinase n=1 Tax=Neospora caninum (strain Liverpool) TaxID=572307 RepID=F0V7L9_NEOCL|nr:hypothetical protein NCLIV_001980 [Neospora caninum Liverpool]CBZ49710.1 hypothetical protein NCLIV_001980 [Neospora caninum Liverpool]CEL64295.1 TPA: Phosphatidylinositol 4-kinase 2 [Neospora caninum Liverpool]|eukprot:XP_003879745.1 hypothetical protein NCLIV_001980 [Neospora caninum Liverpool]
MASLSSSTATERVILSSSSPFSPVLPPAASDEALFSPELSCSRQPASPASLPRASPEACAAKEFPGAPNSTLSSSSPLSGSPSSSSLSILDDDAAGVLEATAAFLVASPDSDAPRGDSSSSTSTPPPQCPCQEPLRPFHASAVRVEETSDSSSTGPPRPGPGVAGSASMSANSKMEGFEISGTSLAGGRDATEWKHVPTQTKEEQTARFASRETDRAPSPSEDSQRLSVSSPQPSRPSSSPEHGNPNASEICPPQDTPPSLPASASGPEAPSAAGSHRETGRLEQQTGAGTDLASEGAKSTAQETALEASTISKDDRRRSSASSSSSSLGSSASLVRVLSSSSSSLGRRGDEGSLLRLFQSDYFDAYFHMYYLFHRQEPGVHEYLVNLLYVKRTDEDIIFYLPQLVQLSLVRFKTSSLHRFLLDKASKSMHLALMASWLYQSMVEDKVAGLEEPAQKMTQEVEMAVVNCKPLGAGTQQSGWGRKEEMEEQGHGDRGEERRRNSENEFAVDLFKRRRIVQLIRQHQHALHESQSAKACSSAPSSPLLPGALSAAPSETQRVATASSRDEGRPSSALSSPHSSSLSETCESVRGPSSRDEHSPPPTVDSEAAATSRLSQSSDSASSFPSPDASARRTAAPSLPVSACPVSPSSAAGFARGSLRRPTLSSGALRPRIPESLRHLTGPTTVSGAKVKLPSVYGKLGNPLALSTLQLLPFSSTGAVSRREAREKVRSGGRCEGAEEEASGAGDRNRDAPAGREATGPNGRSLEEAQGDREDEGGDGSADWESDGREMEEELQQFIMKQRRCDYFNTLNHFISLLIDVSNALALEPDRSLRPVLLNLFLESLNSWILCRRLYVTAMVGTWTMTGVTIPFHEAGFDLSEWQSVPHRRPSPLRSPHASLFPAAGSGSMGSLAPQGSTRKKAFRARGEEERGPRGHAGAGAPGTTRDDQIHSLQILRVDVKECRALSSKKRVPYLLVFEVADLDEDLTQFEDFHFEAGAVAVNTVDFREDGSPSKSKKAPAVSPSGHRSPRPQSPSNLSSGSSCQSPGAKGGRREADGRDESRRGRPSRGTATYRQGEHAGTGGKPAGDGAPVLDWSSLYVYQAIVEELKSSSEAAPSASSEPPSSSRGFFAGLESFSFSSSFSSSSPVASSLGASFGLLQASGLGSASAPGRPAATAETGDAQRDDEGAQKGDGEGRYRVEPEQAADTAEGSALGRAKQMKPLWGELWADKCERLRRRSPYGHLRSWDIRCVLVKGGDDLRQELLASQLVRQFKAIFDEARLPLWLRPYEILVTGSNSVRVAGAGMRLGAGVMEFVPDTCSVDVLKKRHNTDSIARVFDVLFADNPFEAKKNFIESHAAYSLVSYFLQVKDRHNGNLLLDVEGHLIHIDYGYLLSNSPGNINFETSPFKLTQEYLDVMDGETSDNYEYFRTLIIRGFLEARKHADRIILLVEMMLSATKMPCFSGGPQYTLDALRERFMIGLPEDTCIERIVDLIETSVNNFRTVQYDNFQRITNGIL